MLDKGASINDIVFERRMWVKLITKILRIEVKHKKQSSQGPKGHPGWNLILTAKINVNWKRKLIHIQCLFMIWQDKFPNWLVSNKLQWSSTPNVCFDYI